MARPDIPDKQAEEVEEIHYSQHGYESKSFQEALGTVLDLVEQEPSQSKKQGTTDSRELLNEIEDPVERAVEADITSPSDVTGLSAAKIVLGSKVPSENISDDVYSFQQTVKILRQKETDGEIDSQTADRLIATGQKALDWCLTSQRGNDTHEDIFKGTDQLEAAIEDFLRENYIQEELEKKSGFDDFETASKALVETVVQHLDEP